MFGSFSSRSSRSSSSGNLDEEAPKGFMAGAASIAGRLRRMSSSASAPAFPGKAKPTPAPSTLEESPRPARPPLDPSGPNISGGLKLPVGSPGRGKGTPDSSPGHTPRTPRSVEVSVEGQEALMSSGRWVDDSRLEALAEEAECNVTVKTGVSGRNGMHVVLRVGLAAEQSSLQMPFSLESLKAGASVRVSGAEECDIGRLPPSRSSGGFNVPQPGFCQHAWSGWMDGATQGGPVKHEDEIPLEEAVALGREGCSAEFRCKLSVQVNASCVVREGGQAALRVEVEGELSFQPWFRRIGRAKMMALYRSARAHFGNGEDLQALHCCEKALIVADGLVPRPKEMGDALQLLGALHLRRKSPALAVKCLERALVVRKMLAPREVVALAVTLLSLGSAHSEAGSHRDSLRCHQLAVATFEEHEQGSPALASAYHGLAHAYRALGQHEQALQKYKRCLTLREAKLGPDHALLVPVLNNLGAASQQLTLHREAVRYYQRAVALETKHYGAEHPSTASTLANLGAAHAQLKEHKVAVTCLTRALEVQEGKLGKSDASVASTLHNLGNAFAAAGQGSEAAKCHWRALRIWHQALGPGHPDIAATLHSLGNVYRGLLEPVSAAKCFEGALRIREVSLGQMHPETARTRHCAALVGLSLGERQTAQQELETAVKSLIYSLGSKHPWSLQAQVDADALRAAACGA
eukprot:TRINITY_DN21430_c0_g2_i2.p1 TRINITY_DN21430_c0_g2~~TRINITY_DN21430_c0_g2_i2.p1  ORF type:complete len:694 (+),score=154.06 TRINITY_DN21430_c0_g2_i2:69-2150(+)